MDSKKDIRSRILALRSQLSEAEWERKSLQIYQKVVNHPYFLEADVIYCYVDYRREVGTRAIIEEAWRRKKRVAVPRVEGDDMQFYYIRDFKDLTAGYKGILEPTGTFPAKEEHALVLMPGAAFDKERNRIGYGKGYYDRFLELHKEYPTIALAFTLQIVESIPASDFDICPEILITEEAIYDGTITE